MFPHHENEIAQSEAISGKPFANVWMHAEHLVVDGKKMSKSLGNFYTLRDLIDKGFTGQEIRYLLMQVHYKTQLNFTFEGLHAARSSLERLQAFVMRLQEIDQKDGDIAKTEVIIHNFLEDFKAALCDDLNMSVALAALFSFIREINTLCDLNQCGQKSAKKVLAALEKINSVLAVIDFQTKDEIPARIKLLFDQRLQARADKNFALADSLRSDIEAAGYLIEDGATGARLKLKRS